MSSAVDEPGRRGRPKSATAMTAAERMRRMRARRKADGLKSVRSWQSMAASASAPYSSHRLLEARSLAMHAVIAAKMARDPGIVDKARENLRRWSARFSEQPPDWLLEWRQLLGQPWQCIAAIITESGENSARLRQSTPFAGVLTGEERRRIYEAFRA